MNFKNIAILTSKKSWFVPYAEGLIEIIRNRGLRCELFFNHKEIDESFEIVFILSYFELIDRESLSKHKYNLVVHESDLPEGKGWAPSFWQILEGKNNIPVVMFEAAEKVDAGHIFIKDYIELEGWELHDAIRRKQAMKTIEICLRFLDEYKDLKPEKQTGETSFYRRRTHTDSELDINKTIKEQLNLFRIVNNDKFPAFFTHNGKKYILKIFEEAHILLRPISESDYKVIWHWRNHLNVRKGFFNTEPVSWKEHKKWIDFKITDSDTKIYIAMQGDDRVGIIRFEIKKDYAEVSTNLNPDFFYRGLGSNIIKIGTDRFLNETKIALPIIAEIKKDNIASKKAFTRAGYEIIKDTKEMLIMETSLHKWPEEKMAHAPGGLKWLKN